MSDDSQRLMRVEASTADHGERLARIETKLDTTLERLDARDTADLERRRRWDGIGPAVVSAVTSGLMLAAFKLFVL